MARNTKLVDLKTISEINLTPMMDLVFVLLITFMIIFPLIEHQVPINLPAGEAIPIESLDALEVTLDSEGDIFMGEDQVNLSQLVAALKAASLDNPQAEVNIRGDESLRYGEIMNVIRLLKDAEITNLGLVTDGNTPR